MTVCKRVLPQKWLWHCFEFWACLTVVKFWISMLKSSSNNEKLSKLQKLSFLMIDTWIFRVEIFFCFIKNLLEKVRFITTICNYSLSLFVFHWNLFGDLLYFNVNILLRALKAFIHYLHDVWLVYESHLIAWTAYYFPFFHAFQCCIKSLLGIM